MSLELQLLQREHVQRRRKPLVNLIANLSARNNSRVERLSYARFRTRLREDKRRPVS
jgi:hypothetical protein